MKTQFAFVALRFFQRYLLDVGAATDINTGENLPHQRGFWQQLQRPCRRFTTGGDAEIFIRSIARLVYCKLKRLLRRL